MSAKIPPKGPFDEDYEPTILAIFALLVIVIFGGLIGVWAFAWLVSVLPWPEFVK